MIPSRFAGTRKQETPLGPASPVLAINTNTSVDPAPEINVLLPLMTYSSPSGFAVVFREPASDPEPGSVKQYDANNSPDVSFGPHSAAKDSSAKLVTIHAHML